MAAHSDASPQHLAALLMSAATKLTGPDPAGGSLVPIGVPVRNGRLYLGRLRTLLDSTEQLVLGVGFATACWIGVPGQAMPELGRLRYRTDIEVDPRGRIVLDRRVRSWLAVDTPMCFDVVTAPAPDGGVLIVPVDDFARRWMAIS